MNVYRSELGGVEERPPGGFPLIGGWWRRSRVSSWWSGRKNRRRWWRQFRPPTALSHHFFFVFFVLFSVNFTFNKNMTKNLILLRSHWIDRNHEWLKILSLCVFCLLTTLNQTATESPIEKNMKLGRDSSSDWMLFNSLGLCDLVCPFKTSVYFHHLLAWWWAHPSILRPLHMCATGRSTPRTVPKRYRTCTRIT